MSDRLEQKKLERSIQEAMIRAFAMMYRGVSPKEAPLWLGKSAEWLNRFRRHKHPRLWPLGPPPWEVKELLEWNVLVTKYSMRFTANGDLHSECNLEAYLDAIADF